MITDLSFIIIICLHIICLHEITIWGYTLSYAPKVTSADANALTRYGAGDQPRWATGDVGEFLAGRVMEWRRSGRFTPPPVHAADLDRLGEAQDQMPS
jgi:hypothetical protein